MAHGTQEFEQIKRERANAPLEAVPREAHWFVSRAYRMKRWSVGRTMLSIAHWKAYTLCSERSIAIKILRAPSWGSIVYLRANSAAMVKRLNAATLKIYRKITNGEIYQTPR